MVAITLLFVAGTLLLIASIVDLKTTEVPDWISYGGIFMGFGIRAILAIDLNSWIPLLEGILGFVPFLLVGLLLYYSGQWGGGDSKMLMALGAILGLELNIETFSLSFMSNLILVGGVYGIFWAGYIAIQNRKIFFKAYRKTLDRSFYLRLLLFTFSFLLLLFAFFVPSGIKFIIICFSLLIIFLFYLATALSVIEKTCLIKKVKPSKLMEGDWVTEDIKLRGKTIVSKKDLGITKEQIALLKKYKVKQVTIKQGIPFVPSFLIAFILTIIFGNFFSHVTTFL